MLLIKWFKICKNVIEIKYQYKFNDEINLFLNSQDYTLPVYNILIVKILERPKCFKFRFILNTAWNRVLVNLWVPLDFWVVFSHIYQKMQLKKDWHQPEIVLLMSDYIINQRHAALNFRETAKHKKRNLYAILKRPIII